MKARSKMAAGAVLAAAAAHSVLFCQADSVAWAETAAACPSSIDVNSIPEGFEQIWADFTYTGFTWLERDDGCVCNSGAMAAFNEYAADRRAHGASEKEIELSFRFASGDEITCYQAAVR